jgi:hypothetical protein
MPADTDRTHLTPAAGSEPGPETGPETGPERGPVWPVTALVVLLGWCLMAWTVFAAFIGTAPFFGDIPSRARYIESGMVMLTALLPVAILLLLGSLTGSRWGLALLAVPALLLVPMGLSLLTNPGDPSDADHGRPVRVTDAFQDLTRLNWLAAAALLVALGLVLWRRRRQTGIRARA